MPVSLDPIVLRNFAIALLIGALVGIEREKKKRLEGNVSIAGLRTFILFAQAGAVSAYLSQRFQSPWIFAATVMCVTGAILCGYAVQVQATKDSFGITTEMAAIGVCLLGGLTMSGAPEVAVALGIVTSATLTLKQPLHQLTEKLGDDDILAGLKLLVASFIVLPLLPNRPMGPLAALNPYKLWLLVIMISSLSLVGYVATRWLGPDRGNALMGLTGGLVSSTAVTLAFARRSKENGEDEALDRSLSAGILIAWLVMAGRIGAIVLVVCPPLLLPLLPSLGAIVLAILLLVAVCWIRGRRDTEQVMGSQPVPLKNPFSLTSATKFALLFALVLLLVKAGEKYLSGQGLYVIAVLAGLTDVDAISLSLAGFAKTGGAFETAATGIVLAVIANTLVKCGFIISLGSRGLARQMTAVTVIIVLAGGLPLLVMKP